MQQDSSQLQGLNARRYTHIVFTPDSGVSGKALGFMDPSHIVCTCHLILAFDLQQTHDWLDPSIFRDAKGDWQVFYANRYNLDCYKVLITDFCQFHMDTGSLIVMHSQGFQESELVANNFKPLKPLR